MTPTQKWLAGLTLVAGLTVPALAEAQDVRSYDGYCYVKQKDAKRNGLIIGAVAGGLLGSQVSKNERGLGAVIGAVAGGALGQNIGKNSVKCYNGEYYSYQGHYYDPPAGPSGYVPVFYEQRPPERMYTQVYYDRDHHAGPPPYAYSDYRDRHANGWRDRRGRWHEGAPPRGWRQDRDGNWYRHR
jgi:hypothetical protein